MQPERGLQTAETCVLFGASEFQDSLFYTPSGESRYLFGLLGAVGAGGRFCGLKAALLSP